MNKELYLTVTTFSTAEFEDVCAIVKDWTDKPIMKFEYHRNENISQVVAISTEFVEIMNMYNLLMLKTDAELCLRNYKV